MIILWNLQSSEIFIILIITVACYTMGFRENLLVKQCNSSDSERSQQAVVTVKAFTDTLNLSQIWNLNGSWQKKIRFFFLNLELKKDSRKDKYWTMCKRKRKMVFEIIGKHKVKKNILPASLTFFSHKIFINLCTNAFPVLTLIT